jgi:hypothetical protein
MQVVRELSESVHPEDRRTLAGYPVYPVHGQNMLTEIIIGALCCSLIGWAITWRELSQLKRSLRRNRDEHGRFTETPPPLKFD